ncbi:MAG: diguanylate cyclase [Frankiales bacterium]|nr:diguanylate cyclase [Frankiales bacterium]
MKQPVAVAPPRPIDEAERLQALYRSRALGIDAEDAFDDLVHLAAYITGAPMASINFLDEDEQVSAAAHGVDRKVLSVVRDDAICSYTILQQEPLEIPDLAVDPRTRGNVAISASGLRHYTGAAIRTREGHALGAVCVLDLQPRQLTVEQVGALAALARQASILLEWRNARSTVGGLTRRRTAAR